MLRNTALALGLLVGFVLLLNCRQAEAPAHADQTKLGEYHTDAAGAPYDGTYEVRFSPYGMCTALVVETIRSARHSVRLQAYSFTSAPIAGALVEAHRQGV